ncbi:MAG: PASTA domain-containing protein [Gaiellaceae bacterium]
MLRGLGVAVAAMAFAAPAGAALPRATEDRPDEAFGSQVHFVYAVPAEGADRALDTSGAIGRSVDSFVRWLAGETGGPTLRVDTFGGELDVTFVRLEETDAQFAARGAYVVTAIEAELERRGFLGKPSRIHAVYYDGSSTYACGGAFWPPLLLGKVVAMYLRGLGGLCSLPVGESLGYWEFAMLHDIFHGLGAAPTCAPHHTLSGHVSDSPNDLMWSGDQPWQLPPRLDIGRDDYWGHGRSDCLDVSGSPYLTSAPATRTLTVTRSGPGQVTSSPAGIACGAVCSHAFESGASVVLTATARPSSVFAGWSGACSGRAATCTLTMDMDRSARARFDGICRVPNVKGKRLPAARTAVRRAGCSVGKVAGPRAGKVVSQRPGAGQRRPKGSRVDLRLGTWKRP